MTLQETTMILNLLKTNYPNAFKDKSEEDIVLMRNLWQSQFKSTDARDVNIAVQMHIHTSQYMPKISEIVELLPTNENALEMKDDPKKIKALQKLCMGYQDVLRKCDAEHRLPTNEDFIPYREQYEKETGEKLH